MGFRKELEELLNKYSMEKGSNTPDFILANFIIGVLEVYDLTVKQRTTWHGHKENPISKLRK